MRNQDFNFCFTPSRISFDASSIQTSRTKLLESAIQDSLLADLGTSNDSNNSSDSKAFIPINAADVFADFKNEEEADAEEEAPVLPISDETESKSNATNDVQLLDAEESESKTEEGVVGDLDHDNDKDIVVDDEPAIPDIATESETTTTANQSTMIIINEQYQEQDPQPSSDVLADDADNECEPAASSSSKVNEEKDNAADPFFTAMSRLNMMRQEVVRAENAANSQQERVFDAERRRTEHHSWYQVLLVRLHARITLERQILFQKCSANLYVLKHRQEALQKQNYQRELDVMRANEQAATLLSHENQAIRSRLDEALAANRKLQEHLIAAKTSAKPTTTTTTTTTAKPRSRQPAISNETIDHQSAIFPEPLFGAPSSVVLHRSSVVAESRSKVIEPRSSQLHNSRVLLDDIDKLVEEDVRQFLAKNDEEINVSRRNEQPKQHSVVLEHEDADVEPVLPAKKPSRKRYTDPIESDENDEDYVPPVPKRATRSTRAQKKSAQADGEAPAVKKTNSRRKSTVVEQEVNEAAAAEEAEAEEEAEEVVQPVKKTNNRRKTAPVEPPAEEQEEEDEYVPPPTKTTSRRKKAVVVEPPAEEEEDEEEEEEEFENGEENQEPELQANTSIPVDLNQTAQLLDQVLSNDRSQLPNVSVEVKVPATRGRGKKAAAKQASPKRGRKAAAEPEVQKRRRTRATEPLKTAAPAIVIDSAATKGKTPKKPRRLLHQASEITLSPVPPTPAKPVERQYQPLANLSKLRPREALQLLKQVQPVRRR